MATQFPPSISRLPTTTPTKKNFSQTLQMATQPTVTAYSCIASWHIQLPPPLITMHNLIVQRTYVPAHYHEYCMALFRQDHISCQIQYFQTTLPSYTSHGIPHCPILHNNWCSVTCACQLDSTSNGTTQGQTLLHI